MRTLTIVALTFASLTPLAIGQTTIRASVSSSGTEANLPCDRPQISADGRWVVFISGADNLVPGDTNDRDDVFVRDLLLGTTVRANVSSTGKQANQGSWSCAISGDGRIVAFASYATNLVSSDTDPEEDVFVRDMQTGVVELVSASSSGANANGQSWSPRLSQDGRYVVFLSLATNLVTGDTNSSMDVFVRDRGTSTTVRASVRSGGGQATYGATAPSATISADGRHVAFSSYSPELAPGDTNNTTDVFVHDLDTLVTECISVDAAGLPGNSNSQGPSISADANLVAFDSMASNLVAGDTNAFADVFVRDRRAATTIRVSLSSTGAEGDRSSGGAMLASAGRYVCFGSSAHLVPEDTLAYGDVYVHDLRDHKTTRASVAWDGKQGKGDSHTGTISADGSRIAFASWAWNLVGSDSNGATDVFVRYWSPASWTSYGTGWPGTLGTPTLSSDHDPELCQPLTIDIGNSLGAPTTAFVLVGVTRATLPTSWGGTLLLLPSAVFALALPAGDLTLPTVLPCDASLAGLPVDLQALEIDAGASRGVSFTAGLELVFGY